MTDFYARHQETLQKALETIADRTYWSAYSEAPSPKIYGETAKADGEAAFEALLNKEFAFDAAHPRGSLAGDETSPFGRKLGVRYPTAPVAALVAASEAAGAAWGRASIDTRAGVCVEIIDRINKQSFQMAHAVMHTSGQAFPMAFQAGGPHAQDRALEAVAYAVAEMRRIPGAVTWEKPQGRGEPIRLEKQFRLVPRGVAVVIGCATFPTWNAYPGLFASLATGNSVIVKPHPGSILPVALSIRIAREVLAEAGFDPNVLILAADDAAKPITKELVEHPGVKIVDFTGGPVFGRWLRDTVKNKQVYTEEAGINAIVVDSAKNFKAMCDNIGFSLSLYSGQMCTAPQNIFVPRGGIATDEGHKSFDEVASGIGAAIDRLLSDAGRATTVLGAIQSDVTLQRVKDSVKLGTVVRASAALETAPEARTATPLVLAVDARDEQAYLAERFGPISFVIATDSISDALSRASSSIKEHGAITAALYTTSDDVATKAEDAFADAQVSLSINLTGNIFVNQSAAYSDFHVTGGNPAGNASLTDSAYVANRFRVAPVRRMVG